MGEAAAATGTDYKALVCVFLYGGNDYGNTLIPYDNARYTAYQGMRPTLAYAQSALTSTVLTPSVALLGGIQYAIAPELSPLLPIFNAGRMGVLLNVGTLVQPTTKAQYTANSVPLPPKLFSHTTSNRSGNRAARRAPPRAGAGAWATCSRPATAMPRSFV
jgi:uncharacterized protein (DUF1501 family)